MQDHVPVESSYNIQLLVEPHVRKEYMLLSCGMVWLAGGGLRSVGLLIPIQERVLYPAHRPPNNRGGFSHRACRPAIYGPGSHPYPARELPQLQAGAPKDLGVLEARRGFVSLGDVDRLQALPSLGHLVADLFAFL
jgi:hypothetical protein